MGAGVCIERARILIGRSSQPAYHRHEFRIGSDPCAHRPLDGRSDSTGQPLICFGYSWPTDALEHPFLAGHGAKVETVN